MQAARNMTTNNPTTITLRIMSTCSSFKERTIALNCYFPVHIGASGYHESSISIFSSASAHNALFDEADLNQIYATMFPMAGKVSHVPSTDSLKLTHSPLLIAHVDNKSAGNYVQRPTAERHRNPQCGRYHRKLYII